MKTWQNRIVGHDIVNADQLLANERNPRIHPKFQQDAMSDALNRIGWIQDVIVNKRTSGAWGRDRGIETVVDGHLRVALAISRDEQVPVKYVDLTPEEEATALATFDPITALAAYDAAQLDALLRDVQTDSPALDKMLAELAEANGLYQEQDTPLADAGAQLDRAAELQEKWQVKRGDLWQIGNHRLLCGDSTNAADVARLMAGEKAGLGLHDPPYGISILSTGVGDGKWHGGMLVMRGKFDALAGDDMPFNPSHLLNTAKTLILWGANHYADKLPPSRSWIVWDKREDQPQNDFSDAELAWCSNGGSVRIIRHYWMGLHRASERGERRVHPTQKPVFVQSEIISKFTDIEDIVSDWYGGSGTTMVACEQLGRQCRMIEIEPKYCAVILERMANLGLTPQRISDINPHE